MKEAEELEEQAMEKRMKEAGDLEVQVIETREWM